MESSGPKYTTTAKFDYLLPCLLQFWSQQDPGSYSPHLRESREELTGLEKSEPRRREQELEGSNIQTRRKKRTAEEGQRKTAIDQRWARRKSNFFPLLVRAHMKIH